MAVLKALGFTSAAAAIATASITISASFCRSSNHPSSATPFRKPNSQSESSSHHLSASVPLRSNLLRRSNPFQSILGQAMALNGTVTEEKPAVQETISKDQPQDQESALPEIMTEFMVDMKCEGCASSVRSKLESLEGVRKVDVDLTNQVVRVQGSASLKALNVALEQTGRKARLIGQGSLTEFLISATVAEFKGPQIYGVVRFAQVSMEMARIEANFSGLSEGPHGWSINDYGDLTRGAASTGGIYKSSSADMPLTKPLGDLGTLVANSNGEAEYSGSKPMLKVADLVGRALVVYATEDKSEPGIAAAVIARSAGVGENYKKLCTCDGTVIWDATNNDFVKV